MALHGVPYIIPLLVAAAISAVSALAIRRYRTPAAKTLSLILLAGAFGLSIYVLSVSSDNARTMGLLLKIVYLPLVTAPAAGIIFTLQYTGREKWVTRRNLALLSIVPVTTLLLILTNDYYNLMWSSTKPIPVNDLLLLEYTPGPWLWIYTAYSEVLVLFGNILLIQMLIHARRFYRLQITSMLLASFLIQLWGVLPLFKLSSLTYLSVTSLSFFAACLLATLSIFRFRLTDIVPVAPGAVINSMSDGVLILDPETRIVHVNPLIQQLTDYPSKIIGTPLQDVWPEWLDHITPTEHARTEIMVTLQDGQRIYDVHTSPLTDRHGNLVNQIVVLRDITDRKRAEIKLKTLFNVSTSITPAADINETFRIISGSCQELVGFDHFIIFLASKDKQHIYHAYSSGKTNKTKGLVLQYGEGLVGYCIETREPLLLGNAHKDKRAKKILGVTEPFTSQIVVPLIINDECVGALHISRAVENAYNPDDLTVLQLLSDIISSALRNAALYNEIKEFGEKLEDTLKERSRKMEILLNTRQELQKSTSWKKGLTTIVESMEKLGFDTVGIFLVDFIRKSLDFYTGKGMNLPEAYASISLKRKEYSGVKCVTQRKTILDDSSPRKNTKIIESASVAWVPIVVKNEAFAALIAGSTATITAEDVKDLEILAGMCGAFIDRTRIVIEPVTETQLETEITHNLNSREGYIVLEKKPEKSFEIFVDLVTHGIQGFVVSREYSEKIKEKYSLVKTPMVWLSRSERENAITPDDLPKLTFVIEEFTRKSEESVILMDGLEYLITQAGFDTVLKYLQELKDTIILNNSRLIIPIHREALSPKEFSVLEREFIILEPDWYLLSFLK